MGTPLPRIEDPASLIISPSDRPHPQTLDAVPAGYVPRCARAGTFDRRWAETQAPLPPSDFDERYYDVAPDDMCARPFLRGGEPVIVEGMDPSGPIVSRLPRVPLRLDVGQRRVAPALDLVVLAPDQDVLTLTYRHTFDVSHLGHSLPVIGILVLERMQWARQ